MNFQHELSISCCRALGRHHLDMQDPERQSQTKTSIEKNERHDHKNGQSIIRED